MLFVSLFRGEPRRDIAKKSRQAKVELVPIKTKLERVVTFLHFATKTYHCLMDLCFLSCTHCFIMPVFLFYCGKGNIFEAVMFRLFIIGCIDLAVLAKYFKEVHLIFGIFLS